MELTILTPSFNRVGGLHRLFKSLQQQTSKNFEWLIVDDGSVDETEQIVASWQREADFVIRYIYKENGGKHTALNTGIAATESELTFIVDSDDVVTYDAVETILRYHHRYCDEPILCGYTFLRAYPDGKINGKSFEPSEMIASYIDSRINADDTYADKAEVFFTRCLKEFPFPVFPNEKFLGEDIIWIQMGRKYRMVHINEVVYIGNYLEDGLTKNRRKHNIKSPNGCMNRAMEFMKKDIKLRYRVKAGLQYIIYGKFAGYTLAKLMVRANEKLLVVALCIPGMIIFEKWKRQYR